MDDIREVLGAPRWYLAADLQTVSVSEDQKCLTFVVHFMGKAMEAAVEDYASHISNLLTTESLLLQPS